MVPEAVFEELQRYVRWTAEDATLLAAFAPFAAPEFPRIAAAFYARIREHEGASAVLIDDAQVQRLEGSFVVWLTRICGGTYDRAYAEEAAKIGRVHVSVDLPQRYMFGAMSLIRTELAHIAEEKLGDTRAATHDAIDRVLDIELGVMMEAYQDALITRARTSRLAATGMLASGLAHEIRNPLNGARLALTSLKRAIDKKQDDALDTETTVIDKELSRLTRLVGDFLEFAKPKALEYATLHLRSLCEDVLSAIRPAAEAAGVKLVADLPAVDVHFPGDAAMLKRMLENLVRNAVDSLASRGAGCVTLHARQHPRRVVMEITDNGPGLAPDAPIFDAFYSTKQGHPGLGLPIAHRIVSDHLGTLDAFTSSGQTTFRIALPLERQSGELR